MRYPFRSFKWGHVCIYWSTYTQAMTQFTGWSELSAYSNTLSRWAPVDIPVKRSRLSMYSIMHGPSVYMDGSINRHSWILSYDASTPINVISETCNTEEYLSDVNDCLCNKKKREYVFIDVWRHPRRVHQTTTLHDLIVQLIWLEEGPPLSTARGDVSRIQCL